MKLGIEFKENFKKNNVEILFIPTIGYYTRNKTRHLVFAWLGLVVDLNWNKNKKEELITW